MLVLYLKNVNQAFDFLQICIEKCCPCIKNVKQVFENVSQALEFFNWNMYRKIDHECKKNQTFV